MLPARRRKVMWLLFLVGGLLFLLSAGAVTWFRLPQWAPGLVIEYSPLIDPVVRARVYLQRASPNGPTVEQGWPSPFLGRQPSHFNEHTWPLTEMADERLAAWGSSVTPILRRGLTSTDDDLRITAAELLHRRGLVDVDVLGTWLDEPNPWIRLKAWELLTESSQGIHPIPTAAELLRRKRLGLLDEPEEYIRETFLSELLEPGALSWEERQQVFDRLSGAKIWQIHFLALALEHLCRTRLKDHPDERLPLDVLFPLLSLADVDEGDDAVFERVHFLLSLVDQDPTVLLHRLAAMERGDSPWVPGSQRWMYTLLRSLTDQRLSLSLRGADLKDVLTQHFSHYSILIDPDVLAAIPPLVSLEFSDARAIDVLQALATATGTCLRLSGGAVLFAPPFPTKVIGFAPLPVIRAIDHSVIQGDVPVPEWLASWRVKARASEDLHVDDLPLAAVLADLARQGGVAVNATHIDEGQRVTGLHLHGLSLDQRLRLVAWYARIRLILRVTGIQVWPASGN
ncbi:MAG TPA: hypothetical protein VHX44_04375 [Planctomycetota bacterium]|nr:hypothetical protein [Planctomycetota bacterium]